MPGPEIRQETALLQAKLCPMPSSALWPGPPPQQCPGKTMAEEAGGSLCGASPYQVWVWAWQWGPEVREG